VSDVPEEDIVDERVRELLAAMRKYEKSGMPLSFFAEFYGAKRDLEVYPDQLKTFIEELPIGDREKGILRSIYERGRSGLLTRFGERQSPGFG
jgi:hypothetical protein